MPSESNPRSSLVVLKAGDHLKDGGHNCALPYPEDPQATKQGPWIAVQQPSSSFVSETPLTTTAALDGPRAAGLQLEAAEERQQQETTGRGGDFKNGFPQPETLASTPAAARTVSLTSGSSSSAEARPSNPSQCLNHNRGSSSPIRSAPAQRSGGTGRGTTLDRSTSTSSTSRDSHSNYFVTALVTAKDADHGDYAAFCGRDLDQEPLYKYNGALPGLVAEDARSTTTGGNSSLSRSYTASSPPDLSASSAEEEAASQTSGIVHDTKRGTCSENHSTAPDYTSATSISFATTGEVMFTGSTSSSASSTAKPHLQQTGSTRRSTTSSVNSDQPLVYDGLSEVEQREGNCITGRPMIDPALLLEQLQHAGGKEMIASSKEVVHTASSTSVTTKPQLHNREQKQHQAGTTPHTSAVSMRAADSTEFNSLESAAASAASSSSSRSMSSRGPMNDSLASSLYNRRGPTTSDHDSPVFSLHYSSPPPPTYGDTIAVQPPRRSNSQTKYRSNIAGSLQVNLNLPDSRAAIPAHHQSSAREVDPWSSSSPPGYGHHIAATTNGNALAPFEPPTADCVCRALVSACSHVKQAAGSVLRWQTIFALCFGLCCVWFNCVSQVLLDHRYIYGRIHIFPDAEEIARAKQATQDWSQEKFAERVERHALQHDVFFDLLPDARSMEDHSLHFLFDSDALLNNLLRMTALVFLLFHPRRSTLVVRFLLCQGFVFLLRGVSIFITPLPPPDASCQIGLPAPDENYLWEGFKTVFRHRVTCCDVLFSGHTVNFTMLTMLWWDHFDRHVCPYPSVRFLARRAVLFYACLGFTAMLITRFHYTVDLFLGAIISFFVWRYYHAQCAYFRQLLSSRRSFACLGNKTSRQLYANHQLNTSSATTSEGEEPEQSDPENVASAAVLQQQNKYAKISTRGPPSVGHQHVRTVFERGVIENPHGSLAAQHSSYRSGGHSIVNGVLSPAAHQQADRGQDLTENLAHLNHQSRDDLIVPQSASDVDCAGDSTLLVPDEQREQDLMVLDHGGVLVHPGSRTASNLSTRGPSSLRGMEVESDALHSDDVVHRIFNYMSNIGEPKRMRKYDPITFVQRGLCGLFMWLEFTPTLPFFGLQLFSGDRGGPSAPL
ncbi:unnamed protein product [Amoebophrya sp. A120]|nr:unnamed protein product [Amoebophrya sp. A120]|eukprot:GSA120T00017490001.1